MIPPFATPLPLFTPNAHLPSQKDNLPTLSLCLKHSWTLLKKLKS